LRRSKREPPHRRERCPGTVKLTVEARQDRITTKVDRMGDGGTSMTEALGGAVTVELLLARGLLLSEDRRWLTGAGVVLLMFTAVAPWGL